MQEAVQSDAYAIEFDELTGEYQLVSPFLRSPLQFCPWCGGELPPSLRDELFTEMSEVDLEDCRARTSSLKSLADVEAAFGAPDVVGEGCGPENDPWIRWFRYEDVWDSLILTVGEHDDGRISCVTSGKYIGPRRD